MAPRKLRIFYAAGPGHIIGTYTSWRQHRDDPTQLAITYSSQFWDICRRIGAESVAISSHPQSGLLIDGDHRIEHRPKPHNQGGVSYHWAQLRYGLSLLLSILRFRCDVAIIAEGTTEWYLLGLMQLCGIDVVPTLHCTLWPKLRQCSQKQRILNALGGHLFFRRRPRAVLSISEDVTEQLTSLGHAGRVIPFIPTYRPGTFSGSLEPPRGGLFRVLFAGRVERDKGVFMLLEIARKYSGRGEEGIVFEICGDGPALPALREACRSACLAATFHCHGNCSPALLHDLLSRCHVLVAPTTIDFAEGFNKSVIEGVLAGRPVITSAVCPALGRVRDAVVEVPANDEAAYATAILRLRDDVGLYASKRAACAQYQTQFYDEARSWGAALLSALQPD